MRLDRFICKSSELTLEQANEVLCQKRIKVDGKLTINHALQVHGHHLVELDGMHLIRRPFRYILFHKQANTLCSNKDEHYPSLFNSLDIDYKDDLHIVGRLDADTTGLVLLTDDGSWTFRIIHPDAECPKIYRVRLRYPLRPEDISKLEKGILLPGCDKLTKPAKIEFITPIEIYLEITEGRFHQVKRMMKALSNRVQSLHREQIGEIKLDVAPGKWRYLSHTEIESFTKPFKDI